MATIGVKRVYEPATGKDGFRMLVDRLWPRGLKKDIADIDFWAKEIAPTTNLRKWFNHEQEKWQDFKQSYHEELSKNPAVTALMEQIRTLNTVTLLYAAHDEKHNHAVVLRDFFLENLD